MTLLRRLRNQGFYNPWRQGCRQFLNIMTDIDNYIDKLNRHHLDRYSEEDLMQTLFNDPSIFEVIQFNMYLDQNNKATFRIIHESNEGRIMNDFEFFVDALAYMTTFISEEA